MRQRGFTLIELIIFILVLGIVGVGLLLALNRTLLGSGTAERRAIATQLAQARLELIVGQRQKLGFANFSDPCMASSPPSVCNSASGYTVNANITTLNNNLKKITVAVTGRANATLTTWVANYS